MRLISRVEAFFKEFPLLNEIANLGDVFECEVQRIDIELLQSNGYIEDTYIFDKTGTLLGKVGYRLRYANPKKRWWNFETKWLEQPPTPSAKAEYIESDSAWNETVEDAVLSLPDPDAVETIVTTRHCEVGDLICLHKLPRNRTIKQIIDERNQETLVSIREEVQNHRDNEDEAD
jgi:hypothetical protein